MFNSIYVIQLWEEVISFTPWDKGAAVYCANIQH